MFAFRLYDRDGSGSLDCKKSSGLPGVRFHPHRLIGDYDLWHCVDVYCVSFLSLILALLNQNTAAIHEIAEDWTDLDSYLW